MVKLCRHWLGEVLIGALNLAIGRVTVFSQFGSILWILCVALLLLLIDSAVCKSYEAYKKEETDAEINRLECKLSKMETFARKQEVVHLL